jgi:integrase/recombinase XerD
MTEIPLVPAKLDRWTNAGVLILPNIITREGERTAKRFLEFFAANIRNENTRAAYVRAVSQFLDWCELRGGGLRDIEPMVVVAGYIERLTREREPQTVKQHLAAIRMLFDWLVVDQVLPFNPASSVRGPRYSIKKERRRCSRPRTHERF